MAKLPRITYREFRRAIERGGYRNVRSMSKHDIYRHPEKGSPFPVMRHMTQTVKPGTLQSMLRSAGLTPDDLRRLL